MLQWDFFFSLGYLPLHHKKLRKIFTFTFFNYTSQFHSASFLNFGFTGFVFSCCCREPVLYTLVHCVCVHLCMCSCQTCNLCVSLHALLFFFLFHNCIQVSCPIISTSGNLTLVLSRAGNFKQNKVGLLQYLNSEILDINFILLSSYNLTISYVYICAISAFTTIIRDIIGWAIKTILIDPQHVSYILNHIRLFHYT